MGATIAIEALKRDACVTFVYGTGSSIPDINLLGKNCASRLMLIEIETINDLLTTIQEKLKGKSFKAIVHAMAALDYSPEKQSEGKIASTKDTLTITLLKTPQGYKANTGFVAACFFDRF